MKKFLVAASVAVAFVTLALVGSNIRSYSAEPPVCVASIVEVEKNVAEAQANGTKVVVSKYKGEQAVNIMAAMSLMLGVEMLDGATQVWFATFPEAGSVNVGYFTDTCFLGAVSGVPTEVVEEVLKLAIGRRS